MEFQPSCIRTRKSTVKEWKTRETLYEHEEPIRPGLSLRLSIRREVPVFDGKHGDWEGDERVRVHIERGSLHIHWTWPEARKLLAALNAGTLRVGEVADACEAKFEDGMRKRHAEKAAREKEWRELKDRGFEVGEERDHYRHTGKTARQREKRRAKI